jgi:hypothetical protein
LKKKLKEVQLSEDDNSEQAEENEDDLNVEKIIKKEKEFLNNENKFINNVIEKIKLLPLNKDDENKSKEYSHIRTIAALNSFCYGIMKLKKNI